MKTFLEFLSGIAENLVLKKRPMQDGKFQFVVDSDIEDKKLAGNETYKNKDKIKALGFIWDKNLGKWVSASYDQAEFLAKMPQLRRQVMSLNSDFDEKSFGELAAELEEYLEMGVTDKLKQFFDDLKKKIIEKQNSPEIREFLNFTLKFTKRSFNNKILIWIQNKNATHVEGMATWRNKFGRKVKKGAKSIKIWVPITYKSKRQEEDAPQTDVNTDETKQLMRFTLGNVFDIADTEPIPGKEHMYTDKEPNWFNDEAPDEKTRYIYDALLEFAKEHNIAVSVSDEGLHGARGVSRKGSIQLLQENISTMIHELTHEILHTSEKRKGLSREVLELQAEGVTYLVLTHYGLPSSHAEVYLALWVKDPENMKENDQIIRETAKMFIDYIDEKTMESKSQDQTPGQFESVMKFSKWLKNKNG